MRAISAPPNRPEQLMRIPCAPSRIADGDQLRIDFRFADLDDIEADLAVGDFSEVAAQLLDIGTLFPDHDPGSRRMQCDPGPPRGALDDDAGEPRLAQAPLQELAQAEVVEQQVSVFLAREPARFPSPVDAEPQPDRIDLLS